MTRAASFGALALLALASACAPAPPEAAENHSANLSDEIVVPAPPAEANIAGPSAPVVEIAPDGLTVTPVGGQAHQVSFGLSREAVAAELGEPEAKGTTTDCGAGPMDYAAIPAGSASASRRAALPAGRSKAVPIAAPKGSASDRRAGNWTRPGR
ncbi:hypothetical protein AB2M62_11890 [Sphingomonas sp. MMS12-HWE2-04]|uniref:hypothetical protein n=1 Tax=Sphingomonas sp. MMS12-HWE2-04 TaxID=3234199 RepID=UPI00384A8498